MPTAAEEILAKAPMPTALSSREIRETIGAGVVRRSLFSARTTEQDYLERLQELLAAFARGESNKADFTKAAQDALAAMGYDPENEDAPLNSMRDRGSEARLALILKTQVGQARSVARKAASAASPDFEFDFPGWELRRAGDRRAPRDWAARWQAAGEAVGWEGAARGALVALKGSPIWAAIGRGDGGYSDTLGNPYPPFAFNSAMDWFDADRAACARLGLVDGDASPPSDDELGKDLPDDERAALLAWAEAEDLSE